MSNIKCAKLVVMGDISVGKSSLLTRYIKNTFDQFNESTIGAAFFTKIIEGESGEKVNLEIWDTAGQERVTIDNNVSMSARGGFFTHNATMHASETFTIASTEGTVAAGPLDVQGTVDVQGTLVVV